MVRKQKEQNIYLELVYFCCNSHKKCKELKLIKKDPYWNLSIDIMFGLQNSSLTTLSQTVNNIIQYDPNHISTYCLTIEENTAFHKQGIKAIEANKELDQYKLIQKTLKKYNYKQYEVSSFSKKGFSCHHNKNYWEFGNFIGLGPSGHSFLKPYRYTNKAHLLNYCKNPKPPLFNETIKAISKDDLLKEHILANFRQLKGLNIKKINKTYNIDFEKLFNIELNKLYKLNYIKKNKTHIKATQKGLYMLNSLVSEFL